MGPVDGAWEQDVLSIASIYAALGDHDSAITVLEKGVGAHSALAFIFGDPRLDPLRSDPRFRQLLRRVNLPSCLQRVRFSSFVGRPSRAGLRRPRLRPVNSRGGHDNRRIREAVTIFGLA